MGSGYYGELNLGNSERASGSSSSPSSSSSRKGKKNSSEKPKQPQRGLGVAQLEKIRLHGQLDSSGFPLHNHHPQVPTYPSSTFNNQDLRAQSPYSSIPSPSFSYSSSSSSYSSSYCFHPNIVQMGLPEYERTNIRYATSQPPPNSARWDNSISSAQPNVTRPFLNLYDHSNHIDSQQHGISQNSESGDPQEPDLELRLSL